MLKTSLTSLSENLLTLVNMAENNKIGGVNNKRVDLFKFNLNILAK